MAEDERLCTCRVSDDGSAYFNQVVRTREPPPAVVVLAAVETSVGIHVWVAPHEDVRKHSRPQHGGYSETLPAFRLRSPPPYLEQYQLLPAEMFDADDWAQVPEANTNTLKKLVRKMLEDAGYL